MKFLSICSGIEAASVAFAPLGWEAVGFSEIEKFPSAVLAHHYPDVPNFGDLTKWKEWELDYESIDLVCGGTPCQPFSVAGLRKGLDDSRGNLALEFVKLVGAARPRWVVWENVPGVLSSNGGRDFGAFIGGLAESGYGFAYRILDAQYVRVDGFERAVPQRRRRVFVVGHFGDWRRAAAVLLEQASLRGHSAPRRKEGEVAPTIPCRSSAGGGLGTDFDCDGGLIPDVCGCLSDGAHNGGGLNGQDAYSGRIIPAAETAGVITCYENHAQDSRVKEIEVAPSIPAKAGPGGNNLPLVQSVHGTQDPIVFDEHAHALGLNSGQENVVAIHDKATRNKGGGADRNNDGAFSTDMSVRRLTPVECERLMGFPDNYTRIPWRGKDSENCPDGPRYKALGNSWAVNCARWVGMRISMVEGLL